MNFVEKGEATIKKTRGYIGSKLEDTMIRNSVFSSIVFMIIAHEETFKFVDKILPFNTNHNMLIFIHAIIFGLIIYFGSTYIFSPVSDMVFKEGFKSK